MSRFQFVGGVLIAIFCPVLGWAQAPASPTAHADARQLIFTYGAVVMGLRPGQVARIWAPTPTTQPGQDVQTIRRDLPDGLQIATEPRYGNSMLYFAARATAEGTARFSVSYRVTRYALAGVADANEGPKFLAPDKLVPTGGKTLQLLAGKTIPADPLAAARFIYDAVDDHMQYRKDKPGWGRGDAEWACQSGFGNCTDFHSLFIALTRSRNIAGKFQIGFALPERRGKGEIKGYHCWAFFQARDHNWIPVDISEANLNPAKRDYLFGHIDENRVAFTVGRDIDLVPRQAGPPLNFFIYPYVEVDGAPYPADKIERHFAYEDIAANQ
ncbi:MAG TPA: transglutaminase domain-containing protein [Tepidisphaeraceae bacterium]|jgi:transglutaminase-like putative cysteine protease|nr:transglutaminase domain-containing protein [Tepidisphaeraceae bacterium]